MTRFTKLAMATILGTSLTAGACHPVDDGADAFRNGIPRQETVRMSVPQTAGGQMLLAEADTQVAPAALEQGKTADFLQLTRLVSGVVNGGALFVGTLVKLVVSYPPTSVDATQAVWGPWADASDPVAWKVTVTRVGEHAYEYRFEGRDRLATSEPFVTVLSGRHTAALDGGGLPVEGFGSGTFLLDWDARNTLPMAPRHPLDKEPDVGKASYTYARPLGATVSVNAQFRQVKDDEHPGQRVDADYRYRSTPAAGGSMEFLHAAPAGMTGAGATWAVKSRWNQQGAGRADVRGRGGELPAGTTVTASECWDGSYASRFAELSWWPPAGYGNESTDCVFPTREYSDL